MAEEIAALQARYDEHGDTILEVNQKLPDFRAGVLDIERACLRRFSEEIASSLNMAQSLELERDLDNAGRLTSCVDQARQEAEEQLAAATTDIGIQRLSNVMRRLGSLTESSTDLERAMLRAISKRMRLVQELEEFQYQISEGCP